MVLLRHHKPGEELVQKFVRYHASHLVGADDRSFGYFGQLQGRSAQNDRLYILREADCKLCDNHGSQGKAYEVGILNLQRIQCVLDSLMQLSRRNLVNDVVCIETMARQVQQQEVILL